MFETLALAASAAALLFAAGCSSYAMPGAKIPAMLDNGALVAPGGKSACNRPCAALWPPMMAGATDQPVGARGIVTRDDG